MLKTAGHLIAIILLTVITQIGGLAWLLSLAFKRKWLGFAAIYLAMTLAALWIAPLFGRTAIPCRGDSVRMQSWFYCVANRNYVDPVLKTVLQDTARQVNARFPGSVTQILDANFPFFTGFPLLPHLSHDDGRKADIAFYYADQNGYIAGQTRSPVGYFAFEDGPSDCPATWPTLRWNLRPLQGLWRDLAIEADRTSYLVNRLAGHQCINRIFIEPHLQQMLQLHSRKIRFQGCHAARHDDHVHIELGQC